MKAGTAPWPGRTLVAALFLAGSTLTTAQTPIQAKDTLLDILRIELNREMTNLAKETSAPYHLTYRVDDSREWNVGASMGALTHMTSEHKRLLHVQVRVGNVSLDSTHELRGDMDLFGSRRSLVSLPLENNPAAISTAIWRETKAIWRAAADRYGKVKANVAVKAKAEDTSVDFSIPAKPNVHVEPPSKVEIPDLEAWADRLRRVSSIFLENPTLFEGTGNFSASHVRRYIVSSDGTQIVQDLPSAQVYFSATTRADDGMSLPLHNSFFAFQPSRLPDEGTMAESTQRITRTLHAMRTAPVVEPYSGPVLLSGDVSGVFFHEIFGHRVEGLRLKQEDDGQTFKKKVGELLLPPVFNVYFDPRQTTYAGQDLKGSYRYDDEGTAGGRVSVIENGVLKGFLMSRAPIEGFPASNGHARGQIGFDPVTRQSNLIVESREKLSDAELKTHFLAELKRQGKPYGLYFRDTEGGFTMNGRFIPNAFNVIPTEVYRIYADGRPDELVRGVDLVGTPLVIFSHVMAAGGKIGVFNGVCGAESGGVPVSGVSPSLLIRQVEVQKKAKSPDRPPILPRPTVSLEGGE